jgi:hypothetical protein
MVTRAQIKKLGWRVFRNRKPKKPSPFMLCWLCDLKTMNAETGFCHMCDKDYRVGK